MRSTDPVGSYAWDVVQGKILACRYVKLACQRHFDDLANGAKRGIVFAPDTARWACNFFVKYLHHSKGEWAGRHFQLEPWQEFLIGSIFGWFTKHGFRRFRTSYCEVARKNGKSSIAAGVGVMGLIADNEPGAEVYAAATRKEQARIIFTEAQRMIASSPALRKDVQRFKLNLSVDRTGSKFEPLSSDERTLDGLNPHVVLVDELHKHRNRAVLDVLDTAMGARRQGLIWIITTAGDDNPESVYASEHSYAISVMEGTVKNDAYFAMIYTLDQGDDIFDQKVWIKANPSLGVSVKLDDLKRQALKAKHSPPDVNAFKRLRLNLRTASSSRAIDMEMWRRNSRGPFDPAVLVGRSFFGGLDVSSKIDLAAWVKLFPPVAPDTRWMVVPRFWMPADTVAEKSDRDQVQYRRWINAGLIEVTSGNIIDHNEIQRAVMEDCQQYDALSIAYDPWNAVQLAVSLENEGLPIVEFIQGLKSYTAPTKELQAMILAEKFDHGGNEVLAWMAANMHVQDPDKNDNIMPTKKHSTGRIDGMTGLVMCVGRALHEELSPYADGRSLRVL